MFNRKNKWWFWVAVIPVAGIHMLLILRVPWWPAWVPVPILIAVAVGDLLMILSFLFLLVTSVGKQGLMRTSFADGKKIKD